MDLLATSLATLLGCLAHSTGWAPGGPPGGLPGPAPARAAVVDLAGALGALSAERASERGAAERWIAAHARTADYAALAEAVEDGGAEVAFRIARALGTDGRHLGLAIAFTAEDDERLARVGEQAAADLLSAWSEGTSGRFEVAGPRDFALRRALERARETWPGERYRISFDGTLAEVVDRLVRVSGLNLPVVVDPLLGDAPGALPSPLSIVEGTWDQLLLVLATASGASLQGPIAVDGGGRSVPVFVCLRPPNTGLRTAVQTVVGWCLDSTGSGPGASRAARALGQTCWPAGLEWLEERYVERGDRVALEGLVVAASRGRVVPGLQRPDAVRELLALADAALAEPATDPARAREARLLATRVTAALGQAGPVAPDGARLDELLIEPAREGAAPWSGTEASLRLRLVALAEMPGTSWKVGGFVARVVAWPQGSPELRLQALRTRAALDALPKGPLVLGDASRALRELSGEDARDLARLLVEGRVDLPAAWRDPAAADGLPPDGRAAVFDVLFGRGEDEAAAASCLQACRPEDGLLAGRSVLAERLRFGAVLRDHVRRGLGARVAAFLEALDARLETPDARRALHAVAVRAGAPVPDRERRDLGLAALVAQEDPSVVGGREDLFGALVARGGVVGVQARALLERRLDAVLRADDEDAIAAAVAGVERAVTDLLAAGGDALARDLVDGVRDAFRGFPGSPAAERVLSPAWPPPPGGVADLDRLDRAAP